MDTEAVNNNTGSKTNIYINELLCFISNKVDFMAVELLSKLVCDFYDSKVIEAAKKILFEVTEQARPSELRHIKIQGAYKDLSNVKDIVPVLRS